MTTIILTITAVVTIAVILAIFPIILWVKKLAKENIHFTELAQKTGKLIKQGDDIVKILFNSKEGHYDNDGKWVEGTPDDFGFLFDNLGIMYYGLSPLREVFKFNVSWNEYAVEELTEKEKTEGKKPYKITTVTEPHTTFKQHYLHAIAIEGAEMGEEDKEATVRTDAVLLVTFKITNIINAIYKIPPQGIIFTQGETAIEGAYNDYVRNKTWIEFRDEPKSKQDSEFVKHIKMTANAVLEDSELGIEVDLVELKYYDLTKSPENALLAESLILKEVAKNKADAVREEAKGKKDGMITEADGEEYRYNKLAEKIGKNGAAQVAANESWGKTKVTVLNVNPTVSVNEN